MCGICGDVDLSDAPDAEGVRRGTRAIAHRGPDAEDFFFEGPAALGHRRLSILDLEVSHGFVLGGLVPWEVQFSTLPVKEGKPLDFASQIQVDPNTGFLSPKKPAPDLIWSFPINTLTIQDLVVLFPPAAPKKA